MEWVLGKCEKMERKKDGKKNEEWKEGKMIWAKSGQMRKAEKGRRKTHEGERNR